MKKTNNKGFSLVELIIVIAIMAILIGVLAPQYIKYVEKSRVSADKDLLDSVYNALTTAYGDPDCTNAPGATAGGIASLTGTGNAKDFTTLVMETLGQGSQGSGAAVDSKLKSKIAKSGGTAVSFTCDANGNFTVYVGGTVGTADVDYIAVGAGVQ